MDSKIVEERIRRSNDIQARYDKQEIFRIGGNHEYMRLDWTPAQKRRMKKKLRKALDLRSIPWL